MMPPYCAICHRSDDATLVRFADYTPVPDGMTGHPHGLVWLCGEHRVGADALTHLPSGEALRRIERGDVPGKPRPRGFFARLFGR